jgi:hypothetical protein
MRAHRAVAVLNDSRLLMSKSTGRLMGICSQAAAGGQPRMQWRQAPIQIEGRRYFNVSRPQNAAVAGAAAAATAA